MGLYEVTDYRDSIASIWNMCSTFIVFIASTILIARKFVFESMKKEINKEQIYKDFFDRFFTDPHGDCSSHENIIYNFNGPEAPPDFEEPKLDPKL